MTYIMYISSRASYVKVVTEISIISYLIASDTHIHKFDDQKNQKYSNHVRCRKISNEFVRVLEAGRKASLYFIPE
jgi:hypothetical protein